MKKSNEANLEGYRKEIKAKNLTLITKAISHLQAIGANVNQSSVSKTTYLIANPLEGEKGLTAAAICKNSAYKVLIVSAQLQESHKELSQGNFKTTLNGAEASLEIFRLKSEIAQYKRDIKILQHHLQNIQEPSSNNTLQTQDDYKDEYMELKHAFVTAIQVLFERKLISFDTEFNLQLVLYGNKLLSNTLVSKLGVLKNDK